MADRKLAGTMVVMVAGQSQASLEYPDSSPIKTSRSLPTYSANLPSFKLVGEKSLSVGKQKIQMRIKGYPPENIVTEMWAEVDDVYSAATEKLRVRLLELAEAEVRRHDTLEVYKEEYTLYCIKGYTGDPKKFLIRKRDIVRLIKSEPLALSDEQIDTTIQEGSLQYAKDDLAVVDWDGAFVFDPKGVWQETIDLLEVANVHLLRLRVLDRQLDQRLASVSKIVNQINHVSTGTVRKQMALLLKTNARSIEDFSHSARDIQLIGDWYAAKLYTLISAKLHLNEWRESLHDELENLHRLYQAAADHFGVSAQSRVENIQLGLWFLLLVGYFVIFYFDFQAALNK